MSLMDILKRKSKINLFTTPSHAQHFFIFQKFRQWYKYDISETDAHNPQSALESAQKKASGIYKTKSTHFLTNGSTSGIIAAVLACVRQEIGNGEWKTGEKAAKQLSSLGAKNVNENHSPFTIHHSPPKVLIWDNAHPSHKNAVELAGATPIFYEVDKDKDWDIFKEINIDTIEKGLKQGCKAVIVTSPTYEGIVSDVKKISGLCKKYNAYLIVDEAHGALYPFCEKLPTSAIYLDADYIIQSLHKTAGGINPTALLHCNIELSDGKRETGDENLSTSSHFSPLTSHLAMISTTSPSYPMLATIEKNINFLNSKRGRKKILELIENIEKMKKNLPNCEFYGKNIINLPSPLDKGNRRSNEASDPVSEAKRSVKGEGWS